MDFAKERKKAMQIETYILSKLAVVGQTRVAKFLGMNPAAVTRTKSPQGNEKRSFVQMMAMMMAILECEVDHSEVIGLAKIFAEFVAKEKAPECLEHFEA